MIIGATSRISQLSYLTTSFSFSFFNNNPGNTSFTEQPPNTFLPRVLFFKNQHSSPNTHTHTHPNRPQTTFPLPDPPNPAKTCLLGGPAMAGNRPARRAGLHLSAQGPGAFLPPIDRAERDRWAPRLDQVAERCGGVRIHCAPPKKPCGSHKVCRCLQGNHQKP